MRIQIVILSIIVILSVPKISAQSQNLAHSSGIYFAGSALCSSPFDTLVIGFTIDIEWTPFTNAFLQPYLAAGVGISTIRVKDGSVIGARAGDALYYLGGFS